MPYDSPTSPADVRPDDTFTRRVLNRAREVLDSLDLAQGELDELVARNHGPQGETKPTAAQALQVGRFAEIEALLENIQQRADRLRVDVRGLNLTH